MVYVYLNVVLLTNTIHWFTPYDTKYAKQIIYDRHHGECNVKNISIYPKCT